MPRIVILTATTAVTVLLFVSAAGEAGDSTKAQKSVPFYCPVAGFPETKACGCPGGYCPRRPDPKLTVDYKGGKIQFCCGNCIEIFKKTPEKFAAVANHQLAATGQARQFACANCGETIYTTTKTTVEVAGVKVIFCKPECAKRVNDASPKERMEMVFGDKAFTRSFLSKSAK
jgi:YHS domain-containing protein